MRRTLLVLLAIALSSVQVFAQSVRPARTGQPLQLVQSPRTGKPTVHAFVPRSAGRVVSVPQTTISGNKVSISTTVDLGEPFVETVRDVAVSGAPSDVIFSRVSWPKTLSVSLPAGVSLADSHMEDRESIPGIRFTFAVPASAGSFQAKIASPRWRPLGVKFLPSASGRGDSVAFRYTSRFGASDATLQWSQPHTFRTLRTVSVWIPLVQGQGAAREIMTRFGLDFTFRFNGRVASEAQRDPLFSASNHALVVNASDLTRFSIPLRPTVASNSGKHGALSVDADYVPADTISYKWIDPTATYLKFTITRDGIYRVTADNILNGPTRFDLTAAGWKAGNVRLIHRGVEVPILIDSDINTGAIRSIVFVGERLRGPGSEYYNNYTDSSAYFLANVGSGPVKRYREKHFAEAGSTDVRSADVTLHHERDYFYYQGDKVFNEIETTNRTETVSGERFYWYGFHGPSSNDSARLTDTFYVASLPANTTGKTAKFHFFLRGQSVDNDYPNDPTHHVRIRLNGEEIAEQFFSAYDSIAVEPEVPLSKLHEGPNVVTVVSAGTRATIDFFYLDRYEVRFESGLAPNTDTAIANGQFAFDRDGGSRIDRFVTLPTDGVLLNLTDTSVMRVPFVDSVAARVDYRAASVASMMLPDAIEKITNWSVLDARNEADYLIVTHPDFRHAADLLKVLRAKAGLRSLVVDIRDIYNAFGYGSYDPEALRGFLSYAYYRYHGTPVSMVTLLGDGTWDPKKNLNNTFLDPGDRSNQRSFIPTYGNPVSDFYFTLADAGRLDTLQPKMLIARIPVSTAAEADGYVTKVVEYETQAPSEWNRNFLFALGGNPGFEHQSFVDEARYYLATDGVQLSQPPTNIHGQILERTDFSSQVDVGHVSEIQTAVRSGQSIFYFTGHGATFISDIQLGDPNLWRNKEKYPVFITLSCRTGAFAEPNQVSVNESFLRANEGGVIMAFGTTGYGEVTYDFILSKRLFELMRSYPQWHDSSQAATMNLAQLFTLAKLFGADSSGLGTIGLNTRLQYSVLGDVALGFALRPQPEFVERSSDIQILDRDGRPATTVRVADTTMQVVATVHNVGFSADRPVVVRFRDMGPKGLPFDVYDTLTRLDSTAVVSATFLLAKGSEGEHTVSVKVDALDQFAETHEEDNEASSQVLVSGLSVTPFFPYEGSVGMCDISATTAHALLITPRSDSGPLTGTIELELDTTVAFTHAWHGQVPTGTSQYIEYDLPLSQVSKPTSNIYWWRTRLVPNVGDPTDWQMASFAADAQSASGFEYVSSEQLTRSERGGVELSDHGTLYLPAHDTVLYDVVSLSSLDPFTQGMPHSSIAINSTPAYEFGSVGYVLAELTADGAALDTVYEFLHSDDSAEQMHAVARFDSVVRSIPEGRRVIVFTNWQPFMYYFNLSPVVQSALESLGGTNGLKQVGYFESYALIGAKGMAPGAAKEKRTEGGKGPTELIDTVVTLGTSGISEFPPTAAATGFHQLTWFGPDLPQSTDILFGVYGRTRGASKDDLVLSHKASEGRVIDLSAIDPHVYDHLYVRAILQRGMASDKSPELSGIRLSYDPAPELTFVYDTLSVNPSSAPEGASVAATYSVRTLTCTPAGNVPLILTRNNRGSTDTVFRTIAHLDGHSQRTLSDTLSTAGEQGLVELNATLNPAQSVNEQLFFNNGATGSYTVGRDTTRPRSEILVDERHLPPYGFASSDPWITVNLITKSVLRQTDSLAISARFLREDASTNVTTVSLANPGDFRVAFELSPSGATQASLRFQPFHPLVPGQYQIAAYAHDASGNVADTVYQTFTVSYDNGIERVMNYPNPFKGETDFTFVLRNDAKADIKIVVYTVAGHKIRTLRPLTTHAGINILHWDGRDEEGNELANGTYLYRVVLTSVDATGAETTQGVTEKAVLSR